MVASWRETPKTVSFSATELDLSVGEEFERLRRRRRSERIGQAEDARKREKMRWRHLARKGLAQ